MLGVNEAESLCESDALISAETDSETVIVKREYFEKVRFTAVGVTANVDDCVGGDGDMVGEMVPVGVVVCMGLMVAEGGDLDADTAADHVDVALCEVL